VVLSCKRIKDLTYLTNELNEKIALVSSQYQQVLGSFNEKSQQLEHLQQNLLAMLNINVQQQSFFNGQNTMTGS